MYSRYMKSKKNVYLKYTKLHCWSLQADKRYPYGTVFTGCSPPWAVFAPMLASRAALIDGDAPNVPT